MADVFEARPDLDPERARLWALIQETPNLDWLLLTKRPQNLQTMLPGKWLLQPLGNVWLGATIETQADATDRLDALLATPAVVHFVSAEPLLGPLDLKQWLSRQRPFHELQWIIAGGESGPGARASRLDWFRSLRQQTLGDGRAFLFKQWGAWAPKDGQLIRLGKKAAGRALDGRTWDMLPEASYITDPECGQYTAAE